MIYFIYSFLIHIHSVCRLPAQHNLYMGRKTQLPHHKIDLKTENVSKTKLFQLRLRKYSNGSSAMWTKQTHPWTYSHHKKQHKAKQITKHNGIRFIWKLCQLILKICWSPYYMNISSLITFWEVSLWKHLCSACCMTPILSTGEHGGDWPTWLSLVSIMS